MVLAVRAAAATDGPVTREKPLPPPLLPPLVPAHRGRHPSPLLSDSPGLRWLQGQRPRSCVRGWVVYMLILGLLSPVTIATKDGRKAVCSHTYNLSPGNITAVRQETGNQCEYFIEAPKDSYIAINFTHIYNGQALDEEVRSQSSECLPRVDVTEITDKQEKRMDYICLSNINHPMPHVFQSKSRLLKLTFKWMRRRRVGFQLVFNFHKKESMCQFRCDDHTCLPDPALVCNNIPDCLDSSDENQCSTQQAPTDSNVFILILAIVIVVVFLTATGVSTCISLRMWRDRGNMRDIDHDPMHAHRTPRETEVVYVPGPPQDPHRPCGGQQIRVHADPNSANFPPNIPRTKDGEEGYPYSQKHLRDSTCDPQNEFEGKLVRAPPNRTIYEGDSPPPYPRSQSGGLLDQPYGKVHARIFQQCHGSPVPRRCCNMPSNNNKPGNSNLNVTGAAQHQQVMDPAGVHRPHGHPPRTYQAHLQPHPQPPSAPLSRSGSTSTGTVGPPSLGPPPNYHDVVANFNVFNRHSDPDV